MAGPKDRKGGSDYRTVKGVVDGSATLVRKGSSYDRSMKEAESHLQKKFPKEPLGSHASVATNRAVATAEVQASDKYKGMPLNKRPAASPGKPTRTK